MRLGAGRPDRRNLRGGDDQRLSAKAALCSAEKWSSRSIGPGVVFGAAHAYQGWKYMVVIAVLGIMLGWLAQWRRSLLPGMIFHFIQDTLGGLFSGLH
jgi:hypothetical protein